MLLHRLTPPRVLASPVPRWGSPLILSGIAAGLAFLSKAPALFLIPFAGLIFALSEMRFSRQLPRLHASSLLRIFASSFPRFLVWLAVAYLTFVAFWPAAWVEPVGRPVAVFQNAFLSATDEEEASEESYWRTPDLGFFASSSTAAMISGSSAPSFRPSMPFCFAQRTHSRAVSALRGFDVSQPSPLNGP